MESRMPDHTGLDVESSAGAHHQGRSPAYAEAYAGKDTGGPNGLHGQVGRRGTTTVPVHMGPLSPGVSAAAPGGVMTELDPVFGDQVFNIQWVLMAFWPLVIPNIVAAFLPLCKSTGPRFPTPSYRRAWLGNLILSGVMALVWLIIIIVSAVEAGKAGQHDAAPGPAPVPNAAGGAMG